MPQVGCWMSKEEAKDLDDYAALLEISRPSVCVLVVQRELRKSRLRGLRKQLPAYPGVKEGIRVTARIASPHLKEAFAMQVRKLGLGSDEAASLLFRGELRDRWLVKTLRWELES